MINTYSTINLLLIETLLVFGKFTSVIRATFDLT